MCVGCLGSDERDEINCEKVSGPSAQVSFENNQLSIIRSIFDGAKPRFLRNLEL